MRPNVLFAFAISLGCASAATRCAVTGADISGSYVSSQQVSLQVPAQCGALCKTDDKCLSYAVGNGYCYLYTTAVKQSISPSSKYAFYDKACAASTDLCWVNGGNKGGIYASYQSANTPAANSWTGCSTLCKQTAGCKAFSLGTGDCRLYKSVVGKSFILDSKNDMTYWDAACPLAVGKRDDLYSATPASTVPEIKATESPTVVSDIPAFTPLSSDSPPYTPFGPQSVVTDDNEFIETYTFTQYDLPTPSPMGQPPVTTGLGQPTDVPKGPCVVQTGSSAQFTLLDVNFIPIVSKSGNAIGTVPQPTKAPAPSDPLAQADPEMMVFPGFYFQSAAGAPADVYDMVYAGSTSPKFVAMQNGGKVVLVSSSTGPAMKFGSATSIFSFDCNGRITVILNGQKYKWASNGNTTTMTAGATGYSGMVGLPKNLPTVTAIRRNQKRNEELRKSLVAQLEGSIDKRSDYTEGSGGALKKRNYYTEGKAPKCPNDPPNLVARTKPGCEFGEGNFCDDLNELWSLSPVSFDGSCAIQSLCYDQCSDWRWESCNAVFGTAMFASCYSNFGSFWDAIKRVACFAQAGYFTSVATGDAGKKLFYKAQKSMCRCYCGDPEETCEYTNKKNPDGSNVFYCTDLQGKDNSNCGACGRQCTGSSVCKGGQCGCPGDQCGTTCLDLRNNPNNCGKCGITCDPKYCVNGACYKPQPGECAPDPPIQNKDFRDPWHTNWELDIIQQDGCSLGVGKQVELSPVTYAGKDRGLLMETRNLPQPNGCTARFIQRQVKICPGFKYELKFDALYGSNTEVDGVAVTGSASCSVTWVIGEVNSATNFAPHRSNTWDVSEGRLKTYPAWTFNINKGDQGVTTKRGDYFVTLTAIARCTGRKSNDGATLMFRQIDIQQVGTV